MINLCLRVLVYSVCGVLLSVTQSVAAGDSTPIFERDVLPIFSRHCFTCHGKSSPQAGLELRTAKLALRGGHNGPVIVAGAAEQSLLWQHISSRAMPPEAFKRKLSDVELSVIRRWIDAGAPSAGARDLPAAARQQLARYEQQLQPIFADHCVSCHGEDDSAAGLNLGSLASLLQGSRNGPVLVEGFSDKSVLVRKIASRSMPPPEHGDPLTPDQIRAIAHWIDKGSFADYVERVPRSAEDASHSDESEFEAQQTDFWAFQSPRQRALPAVSARDKVRTPIDRWILAKLESVGHTFSPQAGPRTLLRRAYLDLTGLPPSPPAVQSFLEDDRPDAYERLIDQLLASPRYGERWGRHWLDAVGYVDTTGKDFNAQQAALADGMWRYRDYVIQATNEDKPWNRFFLEQLAGDELVDWRNAASYTPQTLELLTATGYLRGVLDATNEDISNLPFDRYEAMFKLMEKVSTSALGLTLACARCHSHKFDPVPQRDYYRFMALFSAAYNPSDWLQPRNRFLYHVAPREQQEIQRQNAKIDKAVKDLEQRLAELRRPYERRLLEARLAQIPDQHRQAARAAEETPPAQRNPAQQQLVKRFGKLLAVTSREVEAALNQADRLTAERLVQQIAAQQQKRRTLHKLQALWDVGEAPTMRVLQRGDVEMPGPRVTPGFLTVLSTGRSTDAVPSKRAVGRTSGLRLALAEWLTDRDHPLTARVIVNRIWHHHFGRGIVATPGNFGVMGSPPTHPELLDWLAVDFMEHGWSAKRLHRLIMTSSVYRQASSRNPSAEHRLASHSTDPKRPHRAVEQSLGSDHPSTASNSQSDPHISDPANQLLWRMNLRRLEAEAVRDSLLAVSGQLDETRGGPPVMLEMRPDGRQTVSDAQSSGGNQRRSVYLLARRTYPLSLLSMFDYPIIDASCTRRVPSATPLQSLAMMNSEFFMTGATRLAERVGALVGPQASVERKIRAAYLATLARQPTDAELAAGAAHGQRLRELYRAADVGDGQAEERAFQSLVHMLLCANEFLYID